MTVRSACPSVAVVANTGDVTIVQSGRKADDRRRAIDVVASITNLRYAVAPAMIQAIRSTTRRRTFDVVAQRRDTQGARRVELPYFSTVARGGSAIVAKRVGTVTLDFADGQARAQASGTAGAYVDRAEATLPADIRERITRKRRAGEEEAAVDPLTQPDIRTALARATFELLIGFQLTEDQLRYNASR